MAERFENEPLFRRQQVDLPLFFRRVDLRQPRFEVGSERQNGRKASSGRRVAHSGGQNPFQRRPERAKVSLRKPTGQLQHLRRKKRLRVDDRRDLFQAKPLLFVGRAFLPNLPIFLIRAFFPQRRTFFAFESPLDPDAVSANRPIPRPERNRNANARNDPLFEPLRNLVIERSVRPVRKRDFGDQDFALVLDRLPNGPLVVEKGRLHRSSFSEI